jgi:ABC-type molybdate transport system permease subunit
MSIDWFPLWLSLRVAVVSTAVALVVGLWLAYVLANREFRFK